MTRLDQGNPESDSNILVVAVDPTYILEKLKKTYKIKSFGPSLVHLWCNYVQVKKGDVT